MNKEILTKIAEHIKTVNPEGFSMSYFSTCGLDECCKLFPETRLECCSDFRSYCGLSFTRPEDSDVWEYMFSSLWQNGPEALSERIMTVVNKGLPKDWKEQIFQ